MRKKIFHNWGLKLISLVIAFGLWFLVVSADDPKDTQSYANIPVVLTNTELLENENKVYEVLENSDVVRVSVRAPKSVFTQLRASDIIAEADVSKLTDINTVAITCRIPNFDVESVTPNHGVVKLNIEDRIKKWTRVQYNITGDVAEGYMVMGVSLDQNMIEVVGPKSVIDTVDHAEVEMDVTGAMNNRTANVEIVLYDSEQNKIESKAIVDTGNYIHMEVEVLAFKEVPVELNVSGTPAEGYLATGVAQCSPNVVKIAGTAGALMGVSKITVPEEQLDITGESGNLVKSVNLKDYLPANVRLADSGYNGRATAIVYIEPIVERTLEIPQEQIRVRGLPSEMSAELAGSSKTYELKILGLQDAVDAVALSNVTGMIDLAAWMENEGLKKLAQGTYEVPVSFTLPETVFVEDEELIAEIIIYETEEE